MCGKIFQQTAILLLFASFTIGQTDQEVENRISRQLSEIAKGAGSWEKGAQIRKELEELRVKYSHIPFSADLKCKTLNGWNIVAELPNSNATKTLMIGAHYDGEQKGGGSIISASGPVAVLELLRAFKEIPLKDYSLKVAFWDLEGHNGFDGIIAGFNDLEKNGFLGAKDYVKNSSGNELPDIYINFDVFGQGDVFWLWAKDKETEFANTFVNMTKDTDMRLKITSTKYMPGNYLAFALKTESYSVGLSTAREIQVFTRLLDLLNLLDSLEEKDEKGEKFDTKEFDELIPDIGKDNARKIYVEGILRALPIVKKAIRNLDKP